MKVFSGVNVLDDDGNEDDDDDGDDEEEHYNGVIMSAMASQITSLAIVYSTVYSGADQRKHQSPALLAFVQGIHRSNGQ